ncbi:MAG: 2Fe-2S iron-sulfur cluster-binding protein, partial [Gammaproteobacteria bacterium]
MSYELTIEPLGVSVEVEEQQTLLEAALRAGIWLPHACNHGLCSSCKAELIDGEVEHGDASPFALMDYERDEGQLLTCCATAESDLVIEVDIEVDADARQIPVEDFTAEVVEVQHPAATMLLLRLRADRFFDFQPGQYLNLTVPGVEGARAFSMASLADDDLIELHVRLVPGGRATEYLHTRLNPGDQLSFSGPYGQFFLRESRQQALLLLAAGSGLSGVLGMARRMLQINPAHQIVLYHGARTESDLYADALLTQLA